MKKTSVLGKGLASLIPEENFEEHSEEKNTALNISMNLIKANNDQPRKFFDDEKLIQLSHSIKEHGVIQPIVLKKNGDTYIIIAGERRWRAAKLIGLKEIPAIIKDLSDRAVLEVSLIENIIREDLNPIEEASAYRKLIDEFNLTQDEIGKQVSKSRSAIANSIRLLNLDTRVQGYLIEGIITEGHGRALLAITDNNLQYDIAQKIIDENLNVRQLEKLIKVLNNPQKSDQNKKNTVLNPHYKDLQTKLEGYFNTRINISNNNNKGKIEIEYYSEEDLERILDLIKM